MVIRRHPYLLIQAVIAFAAGISCTGFVFAPCPLLLFAVPAAALLVFLCWSRENILTLPLLLFFIFLCGVAHGVSRLSPPEDDNSLYQLFINPAEATISATLLRSPSSGFDKTKLLMQVDAVTFPDIKQQDGRNTPFFNTAHGKIELTMKGRPPRDLQPGQHFLVRAFISRPTGFRSPGSFNYPQFLAHSKSVRVTGWISSPTHIIQSSQAEDPSWLHVIRFTPEKIRNHINLFLDEHLPSPANSIYKAILTGDRASIPAEILENFKASGTIHLLAISGLHMGLIAFGIGAVLIFAAKRSSWLLLHTPAIKLTVLVSMPLLCSYALIAGFQTPVVRSLIMTLVFLAAILVDRQWHIPTNIAIAAFLILLVQPAALFTVSFQLSFAAVIAMSAILPVIAPLFKTKATDKNNVPIPLLCRAEGAIKGAFFLSLAAQAGTLPLLLFYFNRISTLSALATLVTEPLICLWSLSIGFVSLPFIFFSPATAQLLLSTGSWGLTASIYINAWFASFPFSSIWLPTPSIAEVIFYYFLLFSLLNIKRKKMFRLSAICSLILLPALSAHSTYKVNHEQTSSVSFLDVGQGNASVIELAGGYRAIIDGGGPISPRFNIGEQIIAPYLWHKGIRKINAVVISHPDSDHFNGLPFIIKRFHPDVIWINGDMPANGNYRKLLNLAEKQNITIHIPRQGDVLFADTFSSIINAANLHSNRKMTGDNDRSLVIRLTQGGNSFLFTGDIGKDAEKTLVEEKINLKADVLLMPHHGSKSSGSSLFLDSVAPTWVVISAGKHRKNIFPAPEVVKRCKEKGYKIFNTADHGATTFLFKDNTLHAETFTHR